MGELWFVVAALCVITGVLLLWLDRRRRSQAAQPPPPPPAPEPEPVDLFQENTPSDRRS